MGKAKVQTENDNNSDSDQMFDFKPLITNLNEINEIVTTELSKDELLTGIKKLDDSIKLNQQIKNNFIKELSARYLRLNKENDKRLQKKNKNKSGTTRKLGFTIPNKIPITLLTFINKAYKNNNFTEEKMEFVKSLELDENSNIARPDISKLIHSYINKNNLYKIDNGIVNKKVYVPDNDLIKLFKITDDDVFIFERMQSFIARLYPAKIPIKVKTKTDESDTDKSDSDGDSDQSDQSDKESDDEEEEKKKVTTIKKPIKKSK